MKTLYLCLFLSLISLHPLLAQELSPWSVSLDFAIQQHDKRLFDLPQRRFLLSSQPEIFGTYQYGLTVSRQILAKKNVALNLGVGFHREVATFLRPFDNKFETGIGNDVYYVTKNYSQLLIPLPLEVQYSISKRFELSIQALPQLQLRSIAKTAERNFSWDRLGLYSVELNPGIGWKIGKRVEINARYRAYQIKKIDRVIFYSGLFNNLRDPRGDQKYETDNPVKFWLSFGYRFGKRKAAVEEPAPGMILPE
ncbi:MAG: hypothetical protein WBA17_16660 [Saprospiraceae bacterium]